MKQNEAERLALNLSKKFGLYLKASVKSKADGPEVIIEPGGLHPSEGFAVNIQVGWRSLFIELTPGKFAAELLGQMAKSSLESKHIFSSIAYEIINEKGVIEFKINDQIMDPLNPESWPLKWRLLKFSLKKTPLEINTDDHSLTENLLNLWAERFFGCVIAISPLEEVTDDIEIMGLPEGALERILINRYERSRFNRALCTNFHGYNCIVCDLNFGKVYGEIGTNFIHIHHVLPLSKMPKAYVINPIKDLIPVCPNCHSMIHTKNPPYTYEELKSILKGQGNPI